MNVPFDPRPTSERMTPLAKWFWLIFSFAVVATVLVGTVLAVRGINAARNEHAQSSAREWMCLVSMALLNYSDIYGHLPDCVIRRQSVGPSDQTPLNRGTSQLLYSWRVEIVPFLEGWHGQWNPALKWDDPANQQLLELSSFYSFDESKKNRQSRSFPETRLLAITGPGTAFGDGTRSPNAAKDSPSATILAVETRSTGIPWPAPGDFDIRTMPRTICAPDGRGIGSRNPGGFHVIFADGYVYLLSDKIAFATLSKFFTLDGAKRNNREQLLGPFILHRGR